MPLSWNELKAETETGERITVSAVCAAADEAEQLLAVNEMIEKTVELLPLDVRDDSMYLVFEWDVSKGELSAAVADAGKSIHGQREIVCLFTALESTALEGTALEGSGDEALFETIRFWVRDYLTTCNEFMRFSLIAVLHSGDVRRGVLL